ncbi:hypothetical protein GCM10010399_40350 [Dactylosporangium fulvum]|uniref:Uncharacterized protein n=1 Tax=Dactylosporangium fulvum TaxID=53359 RepID=A0ABY5W2R0_9ACTN|nr:hypothetical protein [Dactylosporangium fulvum]UWP84337.1 hypothetical protein Dfulv_08890 [Dactylosporangium fulvum]
MRLLYKAVAVGAVGAAGITPLAAAAHAAPSPQEHRAGDCSGLLPSALELCSETSYPGAAGYGDAGPATRTWGDWNPDSSYGSAHGTGGSGGQGSGGYGSGGHGSGGHGNGGYGGPGGSGSGFPGGGGPGGSGNGVPGGGTGNGTPGGGAGTPGGGIPGGGTGTPGGGIPGGGTGNGTPGGSVPGGGAGQGNSGGAAGVPGGSGTGGTSGNATGVAGAADTGVVAGELPVTGMSSPLMTTIGFAFIIGGAGVLCLTRLGDRGEESEPTQVPSPRDRGPKTGAARHRSLTAHRRRPSPQPSRRG